VADQDPAPQRPRTKRAARGRPPSIDTEALLEVAREVFLERGIRATTLEVARRAGISEGAVFHRFKSKEALFQAAMRFDAEEAPRVLTDICRALDGLEIREALTLLATKMLDMARVALPLMMMTWSNPDFISPAQCDKNLSVYTKMLKAFAAYFEARMEAGELRRVDAEILTRTFIGAVHHYGMTRIFAQEAGEYVIPEGMFVRGLVDLLLQGALPPSEPAPKSSPRRSRLR
jgi:AcrR family transcriptional regulator